MTLLEKREIRAVHDLELTAFLERLGLAQQLNAGQLHCAICDSVVTQDTLGMVFPLRKEIKVCCSNVECLEAAFRARKET